MFCLKSDVSVRGASGAVQGQLVALDVNLGLLASNWC